MAELEKFIPLEDAAQRYSLQAHILARLVDKGELRAVRVNRKIAVAEREVFDLVKEMAGNGRHEDLEGSPIRVGEASEKYQIPSGTLSRWAQQGYIRTLERGPKLCVLNEADVARARELTERLGMRGGRGVLKGPVYSV
jgi:predicted site-specific integrase-resolvase